MIYQVCEGDKWDEDESVNVEVDPKAYGDAEDAARKFCEDRHSDMEWYSGSRTIWVKDAEGICEFRVEAETVLRFHVYEQSKRDNRE